MGTYLPDPEIDQQLSLSLSAIVCQQLVPTADEARVRSSRPDELERMLAG